MCPASWLGVEPEPFEMGEHLIEASGKLCLLDSMLTYLHKGFVHLLVNGLHLVLVWAHVFFFCLFAFFFLLFFLTFVGEGATGSCCSLRWRGCWTYFRITWSTEVIRGSLGLLLSLVYCKSCQSDSPFLIISTTSGRNAPSLSIFSLKHLVNSKRLTVYIFFTVSTNWCFFFLFRLQLWTSGWVSPWGGTKSSGEKLQQQRSLCVSTQHQSRWSKL